MKRKRAVILASESPRRRGLLKELGIGFRTFRPPVEENWDRRWKPEEIVRRLAKQKAESCPDLKALIIGMDTVVVVGKTVLGKPADGRDARRMLARLSGRTHSVYTGIALRLGGKTVVSHEETRVSFRVITRREMDWYVKSGEPFGKAGGYAIQGLARLFVRRIDGCYYNVVGFPVYSFQKCLKRLGLEIRDLSS